MSAKQTEAYKKIIETGEDKTTVYQTMQTVRRIEDDDSAAEAKAKRDAIREADLSDNAKREIYSAMIGEGRDDEFKAMQSANMTWDQIMDMYDTWDELNREEMCQLLESEIVVRYWFQAAAVELRLRYDTELKEALSSPLI